jgi:2-dehydro-3-deoxygalactonokinase
MTKQLATAANAPLLGIDWGTTNRRAYLLDAGGKLLRQEADEHGILNVDGKFEESLQALLRRFQLESANVILSGMVGSRNGWRQVPYLQTSQPVVYLGDALTEIDTDLSNVRCQIVPGYQYTDAQGVPDVMRGEETQVLGALSLGAGQGWFVLPGTHSKWVRVEGGKISEIATFMTGELFALLSEHGTLAAVMQERQAIPAAFKAGLQAAQHGGLSHLAFGCRALVVTDEMPAAHAWSYLSGLLIGCELHDIRSRLPGQAGASTPPVHIIGSPALAERYVAALDLFDMPSRVWQPDEVYLAALRALAGIPNDHTRREHAHTG